MHTVNGLFGMVKSHSCCFVMYIYIFVYEFPMFHKYVTYG